MREESTALSLVFATQRRDKYIPISTFLTIGLSKPEMSWHLVRHVVVLCEVSFGLTVRAHDDNDGIYSLQSITFSHSHSHNLFSMHGK